LDRATTPVEETWDLAAIYEDDAAFSRAKELLENTLPELERWRGRLSDSSALLAEALEGLTRTRRHLAALHCYASCRSDRDTRVAANQASRQVIELLATRASERVSYLRPEILAMDPRSVEDAILAEPRIAPYAFFLRDLLRQRDHVLGEAEERILSQAGLLTRSAGALFNVLNHAELPRPEVVLESGERVTLTPVAFHAARSTRNREDRLRMFPAYFGAYRAFRDTLGQNLFHEIKSHVFRARSRGYANCLEAALDSAKVPASVYHALIRRVRSHLPLLHRYLELRSRALGVERLEYPDLYGPIGERPAPRFTPAEARDRIARSLAPLGPRYLDALARAFEARWIDWHPAPGKRSGAYATGAAYDAHPFVLLNFSGDFDSVSTLAHEMGHALHSHFSNAAQPYATAGYPVFVAEVASTVNEALLLRDRISRATDAQERLYLLGVQLDGLRGTLFRQAMFAEFELAIHERVEHGAVPTGEWFDEVYLRLLRDYHGHDAGTLHVADDYAVEWATIPHFFMDFYVYQYATGITAATALSERLLDDPASADRYLRFLEAGGSDYPLALLRRAGVDLESAQPYDATFLAMQQALDQFEELLGTR